MLMRVFCRTNTDTHLPCKLALLEPLLSQIYLLLAVEIIYLITDYYKKERTC